jgi:hypothetical protein
MSNNSWCKVISGMMVDGPRAWPDNIPPDDSWWPHVLVDPPHTINDNFDGAVFQVDQSVKKVFEVNQYSPKPQEQIDSEVAQIRAMARENVDYAIAVLADEYLPNIPAWLSYKAAWDKLLDVTELSWDYDMPSRPLEPILPPV